MGFLRVGFWYLGFLGDVGVIRAARGWLSRSGLQRDLTDQAAGVITGRQTRVLSRLGHGEGLLGQRLKERARGR